MLAKIVEMLILSPIRISFLCEWGQPSSQQNRPKIPLNKNWNIFHGIQSSWISNDAAQLKHEIIQYDCIVFEFGPT